jgi:hypothetical protein
MLSKINIKQFSRVAKIHLVDIVIDGFPATRSKMGNGEPIISESGEPTLSVESDQLFHEVDLIDPTWVADLFDRPEEDPLGTILGGFGTEKDTDRRVWTRGYTLSYA